MRPRASLLLGLLPLTVVSCTAEDGATASAEETVATRETQHAIIETPEEFSVGISDDGKGPRSFADTIFSREAVMGHPSVLKPPPSTGPKFPVETETVRTLRVAAARPADELLSVILVLDDLPADWKGLREASSQTERQNLIALRKMALAPRQAPLIAWLQSIGATIEETWWTSNSLLTRIPSRLVSAAVARPEVRVAALPKQLEETSLLAYSGKDSREAVRTSNLYATGITGPIRVSGGARSRDLARSSLGARHGACISSS